MKGMIAVLFAMFVMSFFYKTVEEPEPEFDTYEMVGRYEDCGIIFDEYGDIWDYWQEGVSDGVNVRITMSDNGTPDYIEDDEVLNIVEDSTLEGDAGMYWLKGYNEWLLEK